MLHFKIKVSNNFLNCGGLITEYVKETVIPYNFVVTCFVMLLVFFPLALTSYVLIHNYDKIVGDM